MTRRDAPPAHPAAAAAAQPAGRTPRSRGVLLLWGALLLLAFAGFMALGVWQVERRAWKLALIERVDSRVHAAPVAAPPPAEWPQVRAATHEYRHVRLAGRYLHDKEVRVQALTELGAGQWVLTPLQLADGSVVLVNRGFVAPAQRERAARAAGEPQGEQAVTGLLRITEPGGGFLRPNDAAAGRWASRDVQAIAQAQGLSRVAPYFVDADADAAAAARGQPVGGLTVIQFRNSHLVYALTWFGLALLVALAAAYLAREELRLRRAGAAMQDT